MTQPIFRTDHVFWSNSDANYVTVVRAYTGASTATEARANSRGASAAASGLPLSKLVYVLGATVPVPGVTTPRAPCVYSREIAA